MIVTTIDLLNYLRCTRYAPLDRVSQERRYEKQGIDDKFQEMLYLSGLSSFETSQDADDEEISTISAENVSKELMNSAIKTLKNQTYQLFVNRFNLNDIEDNKIISYDFTDEITLSTRIDFLSKNNHDYTVITVLPITDKEFKNLKYSVNKDRKPFFTPNVDGIFYPDMNPLSDAIKNNYDDKLKKLMDRHHSLGRHLYHLAFKAFIMNKILPNSTKKYLLSVINHQYVFDGQTNEQGRVYSNDLISCFDMTYIVDKMQSMIEIDLYRMINHIELDDDSRCMLVKNECCKNQAFECQFVDYCFSHLPEKHSILHYFYNHQGFLEKTNTQEIIHDTYDLINQGIVSMDDVPISWLHREKNLMQRYCIENDYTFINKSKIDFYLQTLKYPVYYLDFEAFPSILPRFRGESPYQQSVFQFSLHIEQQGEKVNRNDSQYHRYYLAQDGEDHRLDLINALLDAIPSDGGSIVVYNQTFERNRLIELASLFPKHAKRLIELTDRLFDLYKVIKNDPIFYQKHHFSKSEIDSYNFYSPELDGSYSLKKVLPALCNVDYSALPINNGELAFVHYAKLPEMSDEMKSSTIQNLLDYCQQDSYAMYLIKEALLSRIHS
ncbi:MAG: hypothetical protein CVV56_00940 [Tenericutes bacterium HGW-Tenericutes-1]|jgi:hypothetical protein|nr:MAG: hypothetical protein CVV56_00940 [Tenericutes bacterium HGW-Tenericutes-1]